nr:hypothetical protein [Pedobacter sp. ASV2]
MYKSGIKILIFILSITTFGCNKKERIISKAEVLEMLKLSLRDSIFYENMNVNIDSVRINKISVAFNYNLEDSIPIKDLIYYINKDSIKHNKYAFIKATLDTNDINTPEITLRYSPTLAEGRVAVFKYVWFNNKYKLESHFFGFSETNYPQH